MPLNKTKGNMYDFITHTWNPIKGACSHQCSYCYMDKIYKRFGKTPAPPHLDEKELRTNLGRGNFIFVGSNIDIFADDIKDCWINRIEHYTAAWHNNTYLWHTKNPRRAIDLLPVKHNYTICTTIESNRTYPGIDKAPPLEKRIVYEALDNKHIYYKYACFSKMITIEPIMDFDVDDFVYMLRYLSPFQVNIGADTGHNHLPEPPPEKVRELIAELEKFTKVVCKKNLGRLLK